MTSAPRSPRFLLPLLLTAALLAGCGSDDGDGDGDGDNGKKKPTPKPTTTTSGSPVALPTPTLLRDVPGILTFDSAPHPDWVTIAGESAFVANAGTGLEAYTNTGQFRGAVQTGTDICVEPAAGPTGPVWVVDCKQGLMLRVVPANGNIKARIQLAGVTPAAQSALAVGAGRVFLVDSKTNEIVTIDPKKNAVAGRIAAPEGASSLAFGFGSLWVSSEATGVVSRLDPATGMAPPETTWASSGPTACATPGASPSIARRATCTSGTSARAPRR